MPIYKRLPVSFARGDGVWLYDHQDRAYLDALSGIAVCGLGHSHPTIVKAIAKQAKRLMHCSNLYEIPDQEELATRLCAHAAMDKAFFCNSGAEANEAAIKLARLHGHRQGYSAPQIVVMERAFHGRTMATLTATDGNKAQSGCYAPLLPGFIRVPFGDAAALGDALARTEQVAAVLLEPIQGEGGIRIPEAGYLKKVRALCDEHSALMILDEVQSGMCRTGRWFAWQHEDARPDVMTLAKALGNGFPIGACLAQGASAELFAPGSHGSTFGGNPLATSVAMAVIETLERNKLAEHAAMIGNHLLQGLSNALTGCPGVVEIRGRGLMLGIELASDNPTLPSLALECGLLINIASGRVIRLLPPLIFQEKDANELLARLCPLLLENLQGTIS
ncbi:MAG: acetylornithine transaminase [Candidatus Eutrophobiaceae bacterium]